MINGNPFNEIYKADCGLMPGCSGGPLVYGSKVIGVATHTEFQIERYATSATVRAVFQSWLGLGLDVSWNCANCLLLAICLQFYYIFLFISLFQDGSTFEQLLEGLSALN